MIPNQITIHHTASGPKTTLAQINAWHQARDFTKSSLGFFVGYHYVIFPDGSKTQTRRDNEMGCHCIPNDGKIGICLVGNFMTDQPTAQQIATLDVLVDGLKKTYNITEVKGHRECNTTECPGTNLFVTILQDRVSWLQRLINTLLNKA